MLNLEYSINWLVLFRCFAYGLLYFLVHLVVYCIIHMEGPIYMTDCGWHTHGLNAVDGTEKETRAA